MVQCLKISTKDRTINKRYKENFIEAGRRAKEVRAYGKSLIVKGASYRDVSQKIRAKILELGAIPAFPPQLAMNEVAAHYLVSPGEDIIFSDELIKLDIGVCYKGAIGDCAVTVDLSGKHQTLIDAAEAALQAAEDILEVGLPIYEIGAVIEETITSFGLKPVSNLCGHGLGHYTVHKEPTIPNCRCNIRGRLKAGMTFAIEPFVTNGAGSIDEEGKAEIFSLVNAKARVNGSAKELLDQIKALPSLPFSKDDLDGTNLCKSIDELLKVQALAGYPPLVEVGQGMVAQAENSVLIDEKGKIFITTR